METHKQNTNSFSEESSLNVILSMIDTTKRKLYDNGLLIILWGWMMSISYSWSFASRKFAIPLSMRQTFKSISIAISAAVLIYTLYVIFFSRKKVKTYISTSLKYIWFSVVACMVLINLIQFNVLHEIIFELQHPIFMVLVGFAIVATGGILRYNLLIIGGIVFGLLAFLSSYLPLAEQLLVESIAWIVSFAIPGHIFYSKREKTDHV
ncbi:MAG: hypothetical protein JXA77_03085 [Bacteroidales bacterium]|nr:hypothetical protein [Bacteroidales bacterium]MBN2817510.1 hypothetical protein [Bacteroidales bacterium]